MEVLLAANCFGQHIHFQARETKTKLAFSLFFLAIRLRFGLQSLCSSTNDLLYRQKPRPEAQTLAVTATIKMKRKASDELNGPTSKTNRKERSETSQRNSVLVSTNTPNSMALDEQTQQDSAPVFAPQMKPDDSKAAVSKSEGGNREPTMANGRDKQLSPPERLQDLAALSQSKEPNHNNTQTQNPQNSLPETPDNKEFDGRKSNSSRADQELLDANQLLAEMALLVELYQRKKRIQGADLLSARWEAHLDKVCQLIKEKSMLENSRTDWRRPCALHLRERIWTPG